MFTHPPHCQMFPTHYKNAYHCRTVLDIELAPQKHEAEGPGLRSRVNSRPRSTWRVTGNENKRARRESVKSAPTQNRPRRITSRGRRRLDVLLPALTPTCPRVCVYMLQWSATFLSFRKGFWSVWGYVGVFFMGLRLCSCVGFAGFRLCLCVVLICLRFLGLVWG